MTARLKWHACARCGKRNSVYQRGGICSSFCVPQATLERLTKRFEAARGAEADCWIFKSRVTVNGAEQQTMRLALWLWKGRAMNRLRNIRACPRFNRGRELTCINPAHLRLTTKKKKVPLGRAPLRWTENQRAMVLEILGRGGISQREVARQLGVQNNVISRIVREERQRNEKQGTGLPVDTRDAPGGEELTVRLEHAPASVAAAPDHEYQNARVL